MYVVGTCVVPAAPSHSSLSSVEFRASYVSVTFACEPGYFGSDGLSVEYHCENFYADPGNYAVGACTAGQGHHYELQYESSSACDPDIENRTTDAYRTLRQEVEDEVSARYNIRIISMVAVVRVRHVAYAQVQRRVNAIIHDVRFYCGSVIVETDMELVGETDVAQTTILFQTAAYEQQLPPYAGVQDLSVVFRVFVNQSEGAARPIREFLTIRYETMVVQMYFVQLWQRQTPASRMQQRSEWSSCPSKVSSKL